MNLTEIEQNLPQNFADFPYNRPDVNAIQSRCDDLYNRFSSCTDANETLGLIEEWNNLRLEYATNNNISSVRFTQNVKDETAIAERTYLDANDPTVSEAFLNVAKQILASPFRADIEQEWGSLFLLRIKENLRVFKPEIKPTLIRQSELTKEYESILAGAKIEFEGNTYNLSALEPLLLDSDRSRRKAAQQAKFDFLEKNGSKVDRIYDELTHLRTDMAKQIGFASYTEFRYTEMGRSEYTPEDTARFRKAILDYITPLVYRLRRDQAQRIGVDELKFHDEWLHYSDGNPVPKGPPEWIVECASEMYRDFSAETDEFFQLMRNRGLMDLVTRPNKGVGGYCTDFPQYGLPFIFSNFNGTTHDVEVLTHEAGHAFQVYSSRHHKPIEYRFPTMEACEIHSMSMEYLTWPWMKSFFNGDTQKFYDYHLIRSLMFLPYGCAVDEFQHWVFANPNALPAERKSQWREFEKLYLPWRKYEDMPFAEQGSVWQFQQHIFSSPFYYIDYVLAQICALQFWIRSQENREEAVRDYIRICKIGGSKTFLEIVKAGNLRSPFDTETIRYVADKAIAWSQS